MAENWYYIWNGQQTGPCATEQIRDVIQTGQLSTQTLVWKEGMPVWSPINAVPELAYLLPQIPPAVLIAELPPGRDDEPILEEETPRRKKKKKQKKSDVYDERKEARERVRRALGPDKKTKRNWLDHQILKTVPLLLYLFPILCGLAIATPRLINTDFSPRYLFLFPIVCGAAGFAAGIIGLFACEDRLAKHRATIMLILGVMWFVIGTILLFALTFSGNAK